MSGFCYQTSRGTVFIVHRNGLWDVMYDGESLGSYVTPAAAVDDVAGGYTYSPSNGVDFADLDIPDGIGDWERF